MRPSRAAHNASTRVGYSSTIPITRSCVDWVLDCLSFNMRGPRLHCSSLRLECFLLPIVLLLSRSITLASVEPQGMKASRTVHSSCWSPFPECQALQSHTFYFISMYNTFFVVYFTFYVLNKSNEELLIREWMDDIVGGRHARPDKVAQKTLCTVIGVFPRSYVVRPLLNRPVLAEHTFV